MIQHPDLPEARHEIASDNDAVGGGPVGEAEHDVAGMQIAMPRIVIGVALACGVAAYIGAMCPTYVYGLPNHDLVLLDVAARIGPDGREGTYTESESAALIALMSSTAVLDAALADQRITPLSPFQGVADPRSALSGMFQISVSFSVAGTDSHPAINVVTLHVYSTTAVHELADVLADSIAANGPAGVSVRGRPTGIMVEPVGQVPWHHDWRLYAIVTASLVAILVVLVMPSRATSGPSKPRREMLDGRRTEEPGEFAGLPTSRQPV